MSRRAALLPLLAMLLGCAFLPEPPAWERPPPPARDAPVVDAAAGVAGKDKPVLVEVAVDYSRKTFFTQGVVKTNLLRLPFRDQARFVGRALKRKLMIIGGMPGLVDAELGDQLQITPAFTMTEEEIDTAVEIIRESIREVKQELRIW